MVEYDTRPINLNEEHRQELRLSLRFATKLRTQHPTPVSKARLNRRPDQRRNTGRRNQDARLRISAHHIYTLKDELRIAGNTPSINYVGIANDARSRGGAQHRLDLRSSVQYRNFVSRLNFSWRSSRESLPGAFGILRYDPSYQLQLDLVYSFTNESKWVQAFPALDLSRIRFSVQDLLNHQPSIRDQMGQTPVGLDEDILTPRGRMFSLRFRKVLR